LEAARDRRAIDLFTPSYHLAIGNKPSLLVIILTVDGELAAVLVPIRDADMETVSLSLNPNFIAMLQESRARAENRRWNFARTTQTRIVRIAMTRIRSDRTYQKKCDRPN
jgi:antitoxin (DNA-binding transcriptional repressor) of toxin-antitoxin stability system